MSRYDTEKNSQDNKSLTLLGLSRLEAKLNQQRGTYSLNLADSFVGDDGCELVVRYLRDNIGVNSVDLRGNGITAVGLTVLSEVLRQRSGVRNLSLEWNNISDDIEEFTESLARNQSLQSLDLRNNRIGATGASHLARALEVNSSLIKLDLRWNEIGYAGGKKLLQLLSRPHSLKQLDLAGNKIPEDLLADLEKALKSHQNLQEMPENSERFDRFEISDRFERFNKPDKHEPENSSLIKPSATLNFQDFTYNDELFVKYETQMIQNSRLEARIKELEILLDQESRQVYEVRYELTCELDIERNRRALTDEHFSKFKEESFKKEVENSRLVQELDSKINKFTNEKNLIINEYEDLKVKFENFQKQTQEHIQSLQDKIETQDKEIKYMETAFKTQMQDTRTQHENQRYEIIKEAEHKFLLADEQFSALKSEKLDLEHEISNLKTQIISLKSQAQEDLNDLQLTIIEEESLKFDKIIEKYENRIKNLEESHKNLQKKSQDLQSSFKLTEKGLNDSISSKDSEIFNLKQDISELNTKLQKNFKIIENLRLEINSARSEIEKVRIENEDLSRSLKERKEKFICQVDQIYSDHACEKRLLEDKIDELLNEIRELEIELNKVRKGKERVVREHEFLSETLKSRVTGLIQESVLMHMKKIGGE